MASVFNTLFSLAVAALAFFLPLGTVFIIQNAESQYERVLVTATDILLVAVIVFGVLSWIRSYVRHSDRLSENLLLCICHSCESRNPNSKYMGLDPRLRGDDNTRTVWRNPVCRRIFASLFLFIVFAAISLFAVSEISLIHLAAFFRLTAAACAAFFIATIPSEKNAALIALVIAGVVQAGYGIVQFTTQQIDPILWLGVAAHSPLTLGDAVVQTGQMRFLRAYGSFAHPNILGAFLGVSFFASVFLMRIVSRRSLARRRIIQNATYRAALIGGTLIITVGILLTFSRGVWLALVVASIVSYCIDQWYARRIPPFKNCHSELVEESRERSTKQPSGCEAIEVGSNQPLSTRLLAIGILAVCTIFVFFFSDVVASRIGIAGNARLEARSVNERLASVGDAVSIIQSHPFGIGIGNYVSYRMRQDQQAGVLRPYYEYQPVHSHLLLIFVELGVIGFAAFIAFFFAVFFLMRKRALASEYQPAFLALITGIGIFLFVSGLFDHAYWTIPSAIILWWFCIGLLLRSELRNCHSRVGGNPNSEFMDLDPRSGRG